MLHYVIMLHTTMLFNSFLTSKKESLVTYKHNRDEMLRDLAIVAAKCKTTVQSLPPLKLIKISSALYL